MLETSLIHFQISCFEVALHARLENRVLSKKIWGNPVSMRKYTSKVSPQPIISGLTGDEVRASAESLFPVFSSYVFTTVFDAGAFLEENMFKVYLQMEKNNKLPFRVHASHMEETLHARFAGCFCNCRSEVDKGGADGKDTFIKDYR